MLAENPNFEEALRTSAIAALALGHNDEAKANYQKLQAVDTRGASIANPGLRIWLYTRGASRRLQRSWKKASRWISRRKDADSAANKMVTLGLTQVTLGKMADAMSHGSKAIAGSKDSGVVYRAAQIYIAAGQEAEALHAVAPLSQRLENEPQIYAKLIAGEAQLKRGNARDALNSFQEAQKLADTWLGHFDMGSAYLRRRPIPKLPRNLTCA